MSLISVVTTFYNAQNTIKETIKSLQCQTYSNYEHILINDGSDDDSINIVRYAKDERIVLVEPGRVGRAAALNVGLKIASGDYVAILDADDIAMPERLSCQKSMLDSEQNLALVCTNAELIDEDGRFVGVTNFPVEHEELVESLMQLNPFPHSSVMYRREIADQISGYNTRCEKSIDFNFYLNLLAAGGEFKGHKEPLIRLRSYANSWGKNDKQALQIRYGMIGLINYLVEVKGGTGIINIPLSNWLRVKEEFDQWFEKNGFQRQIDAKIYLKGARVALKHGRLTDVIIGSWRAFTLDPWLWKYRGCNFRYPADAERFLMYLDHKAKDVIEACE